MWYFDKGIQAVGQEHINVITSMCNDNMEKIHDVEVKRRMEGFLDKTRRVILERKKVEMEKYCEVNI